MFAAMYDRMMTPIERGGLTERRRRLLSNARGRVLELGAGTGANLALYPPAVTSVEVRVTSAPPSFRVDRPFLMVIRERLSGTILFAGAIGNPTNP